MDRPGVSSGSQHSLGGLRQVIRFPRTSVFCAVEARGVPSWNTERGHPRGTQRRARLLKNPPSYYLLMIIIVTESDVSKWRGGGRAGEPGPGVPHGSS